MTLKAMYTHLLIPTDGSKLSQQAAAAGIALAAALGARVTALFVAPPATPLVYRELLPAGYMTPAKHADAIESAARRCLEGVERRAAAAGVVCSSVSVTGDFPAEAILKVARQRRCDLIFMAPRARRGLSAMLLGSQTQKVLAQAEIAVLVHR
jgi:nucleotide-binding universal stress UspA family protein